MKKIFYMTVCFLFISSHAGILESIKEKTKNLGKQTPVDIELYAKNPSGICTLRITNITNPYRRNLHTGKLVPIVLDAGDYYRADITHILKGAYEFEYTWEKEGRFIDSRLKTVHIFAYHDTRHHIHKKVDLTFWVKVPKVCR